MSIIRGRDGACLSVVWVLGWCGGCGACGGCAMLFVVVVPVVAALPVAMVLVGVMLVAIVRKSPRIVANVTIWIHTLLLEPFSHCTSPENC